MLYQLCPSLCRNRPASQAPAYPSAVPSTAPKRTSLGQWTYRYRREKAITAAELIAFQNAIRCIPVPESVAKFAVRLVRASRPGSPEQLEFVEKYVKWGAGPRACQYLALAGKALAALDGRFNVSEADILKAAPPVMRHRLLLNFRAKSEGVDADRIIQGLVKAVR